ncbi:MAG TPA: hypothetical protein VJT49_30700 [Amycolatopsis sp.]|uniref:hypothetical protein n=1 Tax=Amycolatopsis sp. TaxID=37632 RepID=UPI002B47A817|nr:hypothetical protein [Amycolatopsis sp.]HKS49403.1 hypothetical protein [Amycolatopsis sp.]
MMRAQARLEQAADAPVQEASKVAPTKLAAGDFGDGHQTHFDGYKAGFDEIAAAMKGFSTALTNLGGGIGSAGKSYQAAESDTAAATRRAGA